MTLAAQRPRPGAFRFASAGFPPCLPLPPVPCGRRQRVAYLLQTGSEIFPAALRLFPTPALFSPDAGGNLQILPRDNSCNYFSSDRGQEPNASSTSAAEEYRPEGALI